MRDVQSPSTPFKKLGITQNEAKGLRLCWSASGVEFWTDAPTLSVTITADSSSVREAAFVGVYINDAPQASKVLCLVNGTHTYDIYQQKTEHENSTKYDIACATATKIRLIKLTEEQYGRVWINAFVPSRHIIPPASLCKQLLFIGDSITAGYGLGATNGVAFQTKYENATQAYAYQVADFLHADYKIVASSGNGVLSRWIPPTEDEANTVDLLPAIFPYTKVEQADLIVCNLGTNDATYTKSIHEREAMFIRKYASFIYRLQQTCACTPIVLVYGLMEQTLTDAVAEVAKRCNCDFLKLPLQDSADGLAIAGHPSALTQTKVARLITQHIVECKY